MKIVAVISANSEWVAIKKLLDPHNVRISTFGECFDWMKRENVLFFNGGWGKVSAAASTQYAIDAWRPDLLINLGTCGGFEGRIKRGTILLVTRTIIYDIQEQMGDPAMAITHYATDTDITWLKGELPPRVQKGLLVSADRDILVGDIPTLIDKYDARAADWESGAIAWVAKQNNVRCIILRGVTDLVGKNGGEAYGNIELFHKNTEKTMETLLDILENSLLPLINPSS
jgi:adenosylhomocysteine nucleosidase